MIARLSGILVEKSVTQCVVDVHGAGYRVVVPLTTFYELPEIGQPVVLHIHTHVREDAIHLYGFHVREEQEVFQLMISVSGIGPKLAVNILSGITAGELIRAVMRGGSETPDRHPRCGQEDGGTDDPRTEGQGGQARQRDSRRLERSRIEKGEQVKDDALSALVNLGYKGSAVKEVVERIMREAPEPLPSIGS